MFVAVQVTSAKIVTNAKTPGAKCYGFVTMMSSEDATKCISQLNHTELHGRMIQVEKVRLSLCVPGVAVMGSKRLVHV